MALAQQIGPLSHDTGNDGDMALKLRRPVDPAPNIEDEDERFAARLPELRRDLAETDDRLRDLFKAIKFDLDWAWKPSDEANEIRTLLTGSPAPAQETMPLAALHAHLHRHRAALDKAILVCQRAKARVEARRRDERIAAALPEIRNLVRERVLLARQLQRKNRALMELGQELGVDPAFGLPSSGYELLGPGHPGDEVSTLIDALLPGGHISRKDLLDAE
jgi:hypothetical protein